MNTFDSNVRASAGLQCPHAFQRRFEAAVLAAVAIEMPCVRRDGRQSNTLRWHSTMAQAAMSRDPGGAHIILDRAIKLAASALREELASAPTHVSC
jgi:hypothetical protein